MKINDLLRKYYNRFLMVDRDIVLVREEFYYMIYFLDKFSMENNKKEIENSLNELNRTYKKILNKYNTFIKYDYIYNSFEDNEEFKKYLSLGHIEKIF